MYEWADCVKGSKCMCELKCMRQCWFVDKSFDRAFAKLLSLEVE